MKAYSKTLVALLALAAPLSATRDASACGGCYHRPSETESTVVTGHKMVLSVSTTQTVLWDQIEYAGDPSEFAWVLPVKAGAYVEVATDAWFEALEAATGVSVVSPPLDCAPAPGASGSGCGVSNESGAFAALDSSGDTGSGSGSGGDPVTVVHRGTVGPYATVTLATDTPGALNKWLEQHGYAVDDGIQPVIDAYVAEGFDFIALRLQPGEGVQAMKPVRVITPGATAALPLRMVAAGTGASVAISLFVISEGRFATTNFPNAEVPLDELAWDHLTIASNYAELRKSALESESGRTWLTSYAKVGPMLSPIANPTSWGNVVYTTDNGVADTIADAYIRQAIKNGEAKDVGCPSPTQFRDSKLPVFDPCPPDAMDPTLCPDVPADKIDARQIACDAADDLAVALTGLHPRDVWLTRLDAFLPRAALATDLTLEAAPSQAPVENWLKPSKIVNEAEACRQALDAAGTPWLFGRGAGGGPSRGAVFAWLTCGLAAIALARRISRSPAPAPVKRASR